MKKSRKKINSYEELNTANINSDLDKSKDVLIRSYLIGNCISRNVPLRNFINEFEKEMICRALKVSGGNQKVASFILGVKPTTLNEKIKKFKIKEKKKIREKKDLKYILDEINISLF